MWGEGLGRAGGVNGKEQYLWLSGWIGGWFVGGSGSFILWLLRDVGC